MLHQFVHDDVILTRWSVSGTYNYVIYVGLPGHPDHNVSAGSSSVPRQSTCIPAVVSLEGVSWSLPSQLVLPKEPVFIHGSSLGMYTILPHLPVAL